MNSAKLIFARLECLIGQLAPKQLVPEPNAIGIDDITLAVIGDLLNPAFPKVPFDVPTRYTIGLSRQPHHTANLVQRCFCLG